MSGIVNQTGAKSGVIGTTVGTPSSKILQVVSTTLITDTSTASHATNFNDIAGLSVTITPAATSSKVLVMYSIVGTAQGGQAYIRLIRADGVINVGTQRSLRTPVSLGNFYNAGGTQTMTHADQYLDSPSTTSATVYKLQGWVDSGSFFYNRSHNDSNSNSHPNATSSITVMEIGA